jgi:hypothetical protein
MFYQRAGWPAQRTAECLLMRAHGLLISVDQTAQALIHDLQMPLIRSDLRLSGIETNV